MLLKISKYVKDSKTGGALYLKAFQKIINEG